MAIHNKINYSCSFCSKNFSNENAINKHKCRTAFIPSFAYNELEYIDSVKQVEQSIQISRKTRSNEIVESTEGNIDIPKEIEVELKDIAEEVEIITEKQNITNEETDNDYRIIDNVETEVIDIEQEAGQIIEEKQNKISRQQVKRKSSQLDDILYNLTKDEKYKVIEKTIYSNKLETKLETNYDDNYEKLTLEAYVQLLKEKIDTEGYPAFFKVIYETCG